MITDIYHDRDTESALIVCADDSVWDLFTDDNNTVQCHRLALTPAGKVVHRTEITLGDRWVTYDDLTTPLTPADAAAPAGVA